MNGIFTLHPGDSPLIVSVPHAGTALPEGFADRLSPAARALPDTDWHVDRLYDFAKGLGATVLVARYSRYVVDLNRPPSDESLYPGQATTGLVPVDLFDGEPLYLNDVGPDMAETFYRVDEFWRPYHAALGQELARIKARHGHAVLWDAHSIASQVPRLFEGRLPDFNIGTYGGLSCAKSLSDAITGIAAEASRDMGYTHVLNGRFKGGYITRENGDPSSGIHAVQLELAQSTYMHEAPPYAYAPESASRVTPVLSAFLEACIDWRP